MHDAPPGKDLASVRARRPQKIDLQVDGRQRRPGWPADAEEGPPREHEEELLTVDDVCAWFKVTRDWVYDEVEAGRLPYLRLGRKHLRFDRDELTDYLAAAAGRRPRRGLQPDLAAWTTGLEPLQ